MTLPTSRCTYKACIYIYIQLGNQEELKRKPEGTQKEIKKESKTQKVFFRENNRNPKKGNQ